MSVGAGVARIQELHRPKIDRAALQNQAYPVVQPQIFPESRRQPLLEEGIYGVILLPQNAGMMGVGRHAFHAVLQDVLQGEDIAVDVRIRLRADFFALGNQTVNRRRRRERGRRLRKIHFASRLDHFSLEAFPERHAAPDKFIKSLGIEIHIGDHGK